MMVEYSRDTRIHKERIYPSKKGGMFEWFGHDQPRPMQAPVRKGDHLNVKEQEEQRTPKITKIIITWLRTIRKET